MLFSSVIFLFAFLPVTLTGYYVLHPKLKNYFLLLMSLIFYAWGEPEFIFIMCGSILVNWALGLLVKHQERNKKGKFVIAFCVIFNLTIFFVYKYLGFFESNMKTLFGITLNWGEFVLPIGISFYTFQAMSYVFDCYRGRGEAQKNPLNTALYMTMFPQLIAGPIVRYETISEEINNRKFKLDDFANGIRRFVYGLAKKVLIANTVAVCADTFFNLESYQELSILGAWLGVIAYTIQIYFDFSGYSDMAIGLGLMFGFHFNENFKYPYSAKTITDFWRRWHISLSSWFRDYVYFPMGGSRVEKKTRLVFNLLAVWLLTGIWHGASWNFVFWGLFYFVILTFEKLLEIPKKLATMKNKIVPSLYRIVTLVLVMIGWVFFRALGFLNGCEYLERMFIPNASGFVGAKEEWLLSQYGIILLIAFILSQPLFYKLRVKYEEKAVFKCTETILLAFLFVLSISQVVSSSYDPFIYFNF